MTYQDQFDRNGAQPVGDDGRWAAMNVVRLLRRAASAAWRKDSEFCVCVCGGGGHNTVCERVSVV
jgi:hypothetical protein